MDLFGIDDSEQFRASYKRWVEEVLSRGGHTCDGKWSESIAVGSKAFVEEIRERLGQVASLASYLTFILFNPIQGASGALEANCWKTKSKSV